MSKHKNKSIRPRKNVADSIDATAKRIAASLKKSSDTDEWDQERIEKLKLYDGKVGEIPIKMIRTNQNIRKKVDESDLAFKALIESIRIHGVLQPPIVTIVTDVNGVSSILLVGGERRVRAASAAGYSSLNCLVRIFDNQSKQLTASISENMNRRDLECLDIGHCFLSLSKQGYTYADIERLFNRDEKTIGRYIKLARWPDAVQELIREHSDKFTARFLLLLASKRLTEAEIAAEINNKINSASAIKNQNSRNRKQSMITRFTDYCESRKLAKRDKDLLLSALVDLGIVKTDMKTSPEHLVLTGASKDKNMATSVNENIS